MALPGVGVVVLAVGEDGPENSGVLVGDRDLRLAVADAIVGGDDPGLQPGSLVRSSALRRLDGGSRALRQQPTQIRVAALGDSPESFFAAGAPLSRDEAEPGSELPAVPEVVRARDGCDECARGDGADTAHGPY